MTLYSSQQDARELLATLFASRTRVAVLALFLLDPLRAYYQRQIEAATGLAIRGVQRELDRLASIALLYRRTEGNRTYYQVDTQFPLFGELRAMLMKVSPPIDRLRGMLAVDDTVRLAFLDGAQARVLVVTTTGRAPAASPPSGFALEVMGAEAFVSTLYERRGSLTPFLAEGVDVLGRREDVLWRHIEVAGFAVRKAKGVA